MNNKRITVIHVLGLTSSYGGNIIPSLTGLAKNLSKEGIRMCFVLPVGARQSEWSKKLEEEYRVYYIPQKQFSIQTIIKLREIFNKENATIIHTHHDYYDIPVTLAAPKTSNVIWHYRNSTIFLTNTVKKRLKRKLHYAILGKKAWLISVSEYYRKMVVKAGFPDKRAITILNGIDLGRFNEINDDSIIPKHVNKRIILAFGYKPEVKGTDILLAACEEIEKKGIDFELWLVFSESKGEEFIKDRYNGNLPSWLMLKPPINDIQRYYRSASIFVSASRYETFSFSVAEATYCGIPVISSDIPGLEWARNLPSVYFFESEDINQLVGNICQLVLSDDEKLQKQINMSKEIIREELSLNVWIKKITNFYLQLIGNKGL